MKENKTIIIIIIIIIMKKLIEKLQRFVSQANNTG